MASFLSLGVVVVMLSPAHALVDDVQVPFVETRVIGASSSNRPIVTHRRGTPGGKVVIVVGSIHGNERSGMRIVREMRRQPVPEGYELLLIETANPDGTLANTRQNARGVDLNRNFPALWKRQRCPSKYCSGQRPATEPETRALMQLFRQTQPRLVVFFHSTGDVVVLPSNGVAEPRAVRAYSQVSGLPRGTVFCGDGGCTGNATQWLTANVPWSTSFVVELECHRSCLKPAEVQRHIDAFWAAAEQA